jgi:superfamily I DNA/RNA helicase/mRNA-degrading endonuclease RelE of RelBE toxin-antitoxin system
MSRLIVHKPTFTAQLMLINQGRVRNVISRLDDLATDPQPDSVNKKRLKCTRDIYRLRIGDYRLIYSFTDQYVTLIGIDSRGDAYDDCPDAESGRIDLSGLPALEPPAPSPAAPAPTERRRQRDASDDLPFRLTQEILERIRVDEADIPRLEGLTTLDGLIEAPVSERSRNLVFSVVTDPNYDWVLSNEPTLVTGDAESLLKLVEGELIEFLLKLNPEQEDLVTRSLEGNGPMLVKGSPGTGKSTVALYRVRALIEAFRRSGVESPKILFTTYTRTLVASSSQLLKRLLGEDARLVEVLTADAIAMELVKGARGCTQCLKDRDLIPVMTRAMAETELSGTSLQVQMKRSGLERLGAKYLVDEVAEIIDGRGLDSLEAYQQSRRPGRGINLNASQRETVWRVAETYHRMLRERGQTSWAGLRRAAVPLARQAGPRYDAVLIDEAQDLNPMALQLLVHLCRSRDRLFLTADANQSVYGRGYRWSDVHEDLRFTGRTRKLKTNHRSTPQIDRAAEAYLKSAALDERDAVNWRVQYARPDGPFPLVRAVDGEQRERELLVQFLREATRLYRLGIGACAVLVPSEPAAERIVGVLERAGLRAAFMKGEKLDLAMPAVKVIPMKSAKGLEFPIVAVAGISPTYVPGVESTADAEELTEQINRERRSLYVAMTRAMLALLVVTPARAQAPFDALYTGFDPEVWDAGITS